MELTKIDCMVRDMMLRHPTLYANRFDAFAELMTNSCFEWNEQGELAYIFAEAPASAESMVGHFRDELAKRRKECEGGPECLAQLHRSFITREERALHDAEFVAAHIDVYAATWCGTDYKQVWLWLFYHHRHGISKYWPINNKPKNITEEWRLAIKKWLSELMPPSNGMMGMFIEQDGGPAGRWEAMPEYATVFNWIRATFDAYTTEADREQERQQAKMSRDIVDRLLAERNKSAG